MTSVAEISRVRSLNGMHSTRSTPVARRMWIFSRNRVSRAGTGVRSKYSRGCGSNVTSKLGAPSSSLLALRCARSIWWPWCTPSNVPIVATQPL